MSDFLILVGPDEVMLSAAARVEAVTGALGRRPAQSRAQCAGTRAWMFPRMNGSNARIAANAQDGEWLLAAGTWFFGDELASGDESELLARVGGGSIKALIGDLEGFFVIAKANARTRSVVVTTDIAGACHCYWRRIDGGYAISSSAAILASLALSTVDPVAFMEFIATGVMFEERSLWSEVHKLGPATDAEFWADRPPEMRRYWSMASITPERHDAASGAEAIAEALVASVRRIGKRFPRVLCDVTGGYDSRAAIMGFIAAGQPFSATVSGPTDSADVRVSKDIASRFGVPHRHMPPGWKPDANAIANAFRLTDGQYDLVEYGRIAAIHTQHAQTSDISINGSYGELARGYWWELLLPRVGAVAPLDAARVSALRLAAQPWDQGVCSRGSAIDLVPHFAEVIGRANHDLSGYPNTTQMDNVYFSLRMQRWQGRIASSTDHIWPCLSPFMLKSVLVPILETKWRARMRSVVVREMLERRTPKLARIPMEHGYPSLPARASNLHLFWPLPFYYASRVSAKLGRMLGIAKKEGPQQERAPAILARDGALGAILNFDAVQNTSLIDTQGFESFLKAAATSGFEFEGQWCRLLTVEYALHEADQARRAANT